MGRCARLKEEFSTQNLRVSYEYPDDFILHQWKTDIYVDPFYLFYRFSFLLTFLVIGYIAVRWSWYLPLSTRLKSAVFLTNWSFCICLIDALLGLWLVTKAYIKQSVTPATVVPDFPKLCRVYWVVQNVATELAFAVSITYWSLLSYAENLGIGRWTSALHIWNSSLLLMDFFIVSVPVKIAHVYFSIIVGFIYSVFTYVYYHLGGTRLDGRHYIYKPICWRDHPIRAVAMCFSAMLFLLVVRIFMFGLFRLRVWIFYTFYDEADVTQTARRRYVL